MIIIIILIIKFICRRDVLLSVFPVGKTGFTGLADNNASLFLLRSEKSISRISRLHARMMTVDVGDKLREFIYSLVKAGDDLSQSEIMRDTLRQRREIRLNYVFRNYANCWPESAVAAR